MESKVVKNTKEINPNHKLWIYSPSGNIWLKSLNGLILIYANTKGLELGQQIPLSVLDSKAVENGYKPFHGTIELKE